MAGAVTSLVDPETGLTVAQHDGRVWFKSGGNYFSAGSVTEGLQSDPTAALATPDEVSHRLALREQDTLTGQAKIAAKEVGTHAIDVATGLIRYPAMGMAALAGDQKGLDELQQLGGQKIFENTYGIYKELTGQGNAEAAGRKYQQATALQAEANPNTATAAGIVGDVAPLLATGGLSAAGKVSGGLLSEGVAENTVGRLGGGLAAKVGTRALAGAIQNAGYGMQAASEQAYINDEPLTRQKLWAGGGMGALFGGVLSGGLALGGAGIGAIARPKLSSVIGKVDPEGSIGKAIGDSTVTKEGAQEVADRVMEQEGVPAAPGLGEKLHSLLTDIQAATTDADRAAIDKFGIGAILDPKTRVKALSGIQMFRDRPIIIEKASGEIADSMGELEKHAGGEVFESVRDLGMKRDAWQKLVDPAKRGEQVDAARAFIADTRSRLESMLEVEEEAPATKIDTDAGVASDPLRSGVGGFRYLRTGMRDLEQHRGAYKGVTTPEEATEIAMGEQPARNTGQTFDPIEVHMEPGEPPILADGRHRLTAAKEAGATDIIAKVKHYDVAGNLIREEKATLPIGDLTPVESAGRTPAEPRFDALSSKIEKSMSPEERKAVYDYTTTDYLGMNKAARAPEEYLKQHGLLLADMQQKNRRLSALLERQVAEGNVYRGEVQRVMNLPEETVDGWLRTGSVSNESPWSTTANAEHMASTTEGKLRGNVRLHIVGSDAVPVAKMSKVAAEEEAIIPSGRSYLVNREEMQDGVHHIWLEQARPSGSTVSKVAAEPAEIPAAFGDAARIKSALGHARKLEKALAADDIDGAGAAIELDAFKRNLGKLTKKAITRFKALSRNGDIEADAVESTARSFSDTYEQARQLLMNQDTWGKAGAAQQEINQGWVNWLDSRKMYSGSILRNTGEAETAGFSGWKTQPRMEVDPNKVGSWIDAFGTGRGKLNDQYIRAHIDATEQLTNTIGKYVDSGDLAKSVQAVKDAALKIKSNLKVASETVAVANQVQLAGTAHVTTAAKLGMAGAGAVLGGPVGAAAGAAMSFLTSPGKILQAAMAIQGLLSKVDKQKSGLIEGFFSKAGAAVKKARPFAEDTVTTEALHASEALDSGSTARRVTNAVGANAMRFLTHDTQPHAEAYQRRRDQLAALTSNPTLATHQIAASLGALPGIAPQLASSMAMDTMRNLSLLQQMAPTATPVGGLFQGKASRPTFTPQQDIAKFAQQWDGVMNPLSVLHDVSRGALSLDKVTAARAAHPELFAEIATDFLERMANSREPMSHQAALQADLLLGLNGAGEPSVEPGFLSRIAMLNQADQQDQRSPPSPRAPVNLAKGRATLSQSLEGA